VRPPPNDPFLLAVAERVRTILARQPACTLHHLADLLDLGPDQLCELMNGRNHPIDPVLVVDVVTAFVREFAVDPQWLLTGKYDGAVHRQALTLGENRSAAGTRELRDFIDKQYLEARSPSRNFRWSGLFGLRI
jgi:hypothetical protein